MLFDFGLIVLVFQIPAALVAYFAAYGAKWEITQAAPEYAARLYVPLTDQLLSRSWPIRSRVLFRAPVPATLAATVRMLRVVYAINWTCFALFAACLLGQMIPAWGR